MVLLSREEGRERRVEGVHRERRGETLGEGGFEARDHQEGHLLGWRERLQVCVVWGEVVGFAVYDDDLAIEAGDGAEAVVAVLEDFREGGACCADAVHEGVEERVLVEGVGFCHGCGCGCGRGCGV